MKTISARTTAALMTALIAISSMGSGMVLCLGEGGHIAIEAPAKGHCGVHQEGSHDACGDDHGTKCSIAVAEDHCHGCVDIPIPELNNAEAAKHQQSSMSLRQALAACSDYSPSFAAATLIYAASPPSAADQLHAVPGTTTVLRI